jgi:hypothetical protein
VELILRSDDGSEAVTVDYATEHDARFNPLTIDYRYEVEVPEPESVDLDKEHIDGTFTPPPKTKGEVW